MSSNVARAPTAAERETIKVLQRDLDKSCGGYRFRS
jgi:hypothetical protein